MAVFSFFNIYTIKESIGIKRNTNLASWKHTYIILTPQAKPHFYIVKPGFKEVYTFSFLFLLKNVDCGYSLELPRQSGSNEYPQYIVKPGFKEVYIFFLISAQKRRLWVLVRTAPANRF